MRHHNIVRITLFALLGAAVSSGARATDELGPCSNEQYGADARCGKMSVPEDRSQAGGRAIDLNIVLLPATGSATREPLFFLAGGPGQGGTDLAPLALGPFSPVRRARDIVLVDQRGTGGSSRIDCPVDPAQSPQGVFGNLFDPSQVRECLKGAKQHADPKLYATDQAVDDLEAVREMLDYEKVFLWGGSGGTRTALIWMRRYPESVAGALLDGIAPSDLKAPSTFARGCQDTLDRVFAECREQMECHAAFPNLETAFEKLLRLFEDGPVTTHIIDPQGTNVAVEMYRGDFAYAVRGLSYRSRSLVKLPAMIHLAAQSGDIHPFAQTYWQRQLGLRPYIAMGVHFSVYCSEDLPFISDQDVASFTDNTYVGRYLYDQYNGACQEWEATPVDESFLQPVQSDIPVLLFSGYYDPSTPVRLGEQVATHLPNSRHVVVRNESHGAGFGCGRQAAIDFLTSGSLDDLGPICEDVGSIQYEVSP